MPSLVGSEMCIRDRGVYTIQQTSSINTCILNTFAGRLLDRINTPLSCVKSEKMQKKINKNTRKGKDDIALTDNRKPITKLQDDTYHIPDIRPIWDRIVHVSCHPTQTNAPRLNLSHPRCCSIYLSRRDGKMSCAQLTLMLVTWLYTEMIYLSAVSHTTNADIYCGCPPNWPIHRYAQP